MLDVFRDGTEKRCVSCASRGLFKHLESTENSGIYYCTECDEEDHVVHSDGVCNTTSCTEEQYSFFVESVNGVQMCVGNCSLFAIWPVDTERKEHKCISSCATAYTLTNVKHNDIDVEVAVCQDCNEKMYRDSSTAINGVPQCVSRCPASLPYVEDK